MSLRAQCGNCFRVYNLADQMAGKTVRCKDCGATFVVTAAATDVTARPPAPKPPPLPAKMPLTVADEFDDHRPGEPRRSRRGYVYDDAEVDDRSRRRQPFSKPAKSGFPPWQYVLLLVGGYWLLGVALALLVPVVGHLWLLIGCGALLLTGGIILFVMAFQEDVVCGVLYLLVPFYALYFIMTRYQKTWRPFHLTVYGGLMFGAVVVLNMTSPTGRNGLLGEQLGLAPMIKNAPPNPLVKGAPPVEPQARKEKIEKELNQDEEPKQTGDSELDQRLADLRARPFQLDRFLQVPVIEEHRAIVGRELANALKHKDCDKVRAIQGLGAWGTAEQVPLLLEYVTGSDHYLRGQAILAVCKLKDQRAIKPVAENLVDQQNRSPALRGLHMFGSVAEPEVIPRLSTMDPRFASEVMQLLSAIGTERSLPHLQAVLNGQQGIEPMASYAIHAIEYRAQNRPRPKVPEGPRKDADEPLLTGNRELDLLLFQLRTDPSQALGRLIEMPVMDEDRAVAAWELANLLIGTLDPFIKQKTIEALGNWGTAKEVPLLIDVVDLDDQPGKLSAIMAVSRLKDSRAIKSVAECLHDQRTRSEAAKALRMFGPAAEPEVLRYLSHNDHQVVSTTIAILREIGGERSVAILRDMAKEGSRFETMANVAIGSIQSHNQNATLPNNAASDPPHQTGNKELDLYLAQLKIDPLLGLSGLMGMAVIDEHRVIVGRELGNLLSSGRHKEIAIELLGKWGTANEVPLLVQFIDSGSSAERRYAIRAVRNFKDLRAIQPMVSCLDHPFVRTEAARGLRDFGPAAESAVIPLLSSESLEIAIIAVSILNDIGTAQSVLPLQAIVIGERASLVGPANTAILEIKKRGQK